MASGFLKNRTVNQDITRDELAAIAREKQPGFIVVNHAVEGPNQNYLTPENTVPGEMLPYPWESFIIAGGGWSWMPDPKFMTPRQAIHLLIDIVAKGKSRISFSDEVAEFVSWWIASIVVTIFNLKVRKGLRKGR